MPTRAEIQANVRTQIDAKLGEANATFTYRDPAGVLTPTKGWKLKASYSESDGESVKLGSAKFTILANEIGVVPVIDGWILHGSSEYYIAKVTPDAMGVAYRCFSSS